MSTILHDRHTHVTHNACARKIVLEKSIEFLGHGEPNSRASKTLGFFRQLFLHSPHGRDMSPGFVTGRRSLFNLSVCGLCQWLSCLCALHVLAVSAGSKLAVRVFRPPTPRLIHIWLRCHGLNLFVMCNFLHNERVLRKRYSAACCRYPPRYCYLPRPAAPALGART